MNRKLYARIATAIQARDNCARANNTEWHKRHTDTIDSLVADYMPSGSGIDCGTKIDLERSTPERLVFYTSFHHMDEAGGYDGWTEHTVTVTPSLSCGFNLTVSGRNRNDIKDYLAEVFHFALSADVADADEAYAA